MKHIGILGGTFDPIHNGHLSMALEAKNAMGLDLVYFLPASMPPLKNQQPIASPEQRYRMVELAIRGIPFFDILDWEIGKKTTCYSIETARLLHKNWPSFKFYWIIGADLVEYLRSWVCIEELVQLVNFIAIERKGYSIKPPYIPNLSIHKVEGKNLDISSTDIREKVKNHLSIENLVPLTVNNYIQVHKLYHL